LDHAAVPSKLSSNKLAGQLEIQIARAAAELGVQIEESQASTLSQFAQLLLKWNSVHNLTSIESVQQVLTHHLLDSLAIVPAISQVQNSSPERLRVLDVGAGGGLPGIPVAIAIPDASVTLIDKVEKKAAFLTQAKLELRLGNLECVHGRVEAWQPAAHFNVIVSRAFSSLSEMVRLTRHLLAPGGAWYAMKGLLPHAEIDALRESAPDVKVGDVIKLHVPGLNAERSLVLLHVAGA